MNPRHCPLVTTDTGLIRRYLESLPLDELIFQTEQILSGLSTSERITYDISRYCNEYADINGRISFILTLIENGIYSSVHVPLSYQNNPRLIDLVRTKQYEYYIPKAREQAKESAALTDDIEESKKTISVTNPRWEHTDEKRKEASPEVAAVGDAVMLLVDVKDYPEGAPVTFDIFDASKEPAMRIDTVKGKNEGGTSKVTWTVADPNEKGKELKLEFEGSARSKSSGKAPIDIASDIYRVELVDDEGNKLEGIQVEFTVPGEDPVVVETDADGIAEHPAKDPAVDADVRILWGGQAGGSTTTATGGYEVLLVDEQEKPMVGVDVCFTVDGVKSIVSTDENGRAFLEAQAGSLSPAEVTIPGGNQLIDENPDPDVIQITVVDADGRPVQGAEVVFTIDGDEYVVLSDENGRAKLEHNDADEALVTIRKKAETNPVSEAPKDNSPYSDIKTRALTDEQVREALQYHVDQGDIKLTVEKVPDGGKRVSLSEDTVAGVMIMQLVDPFVRGTEKSGDAPGQKHERDKFSCKPLTAYHRSLLNQRHALGIVRLCKNWLAPSGFKVMYTQGMNGDNTRKDCHGWGCALDFGGASKELPVGTSNCTVRLGTDFIVYLHWGLIPMWKPDTVAASSDPGTWERFESWKIDDNTDFTKKPSGKKLHYRLDPPPYQHAVGGKEPSASIKDHFKQAGSFFKDVVYKFAVEEYSDASSDLGTAAAGGPATEIDSHSGHFVLHPDYPKPNDSNSKYGRNAHNNHLHMQLGKTNYDAIA
jgi:hypothetical protein